MEFVDVARIERLEDWDKPIGGDIVSDHEGSQSNQADTLNRVMLLTKHWQHKGFVDLVVDIGGQRR